MVRGSRIWDQFPRISAEDLQQGTGSRRIVRGCRGASRRRAVRGTFQIGRGRRIVAGLTGNKNKKKPARSGLNLSCERVLVYALSSTLGGILAPVDALTFWSRNS